MPLFFLLYLPLFCERAEILLRGLVLVMGICELCGRLDTLLWLAVVISTPCSRAVSKTASLFSPEDGLPADRPWEAFLVGPWHQLWQPWLWFWRALCARWNDPTGLFDLIPLGQLGKRGCSLSTLVQLQVGRGPSAVVSSHATGVLAPFSW